MTEFPCERCGVCCQNVNRAPETRFLDRGDGTCLHYVESSKLCGIYDIRPDICRVDQQYHANYERFIEWPEFVKINLEACELLRSGKI